MNDDKLRKFEEDIRREQERERERQRDEWKRINEQKEGEGQNKRDNTPKDYGRPADERPKK
jgi:hypothetical protein